VDQAGRERGMAQVEKLTAYKPKQYTDMRQLFDDKEIDAVSFATPNHWHALGTIWACQAGKDVYVEKPSAADTQSALDMYRQCQQAGLKNGVVQYNYGHDNWGYCIAHVTYPEMRSANNVFRYNVCSNNGQKSSLSSQGDFTLDDGRDPDDGVQIYNNTFVNGSINDSTGILLSSTHTIAIRYNKANAGIGIEAAARSFGLQFIPLRKEEFDLSHDNDAATIAGLSATGADDHERRGNHDPGLRGPSRSHG
jgi:hypothetical protein